MNADNTLDLTFDQQISEVSKTLAAQNDRIRKYENSLAICHQRVLSLSDRESHYVNPEECYQSALTYSRRICDASYLEIAHELNELADEMCRRLGIRIGREPNALFGWVNLYPLEVLQECSIKLDLDRKPNMILDQQFDLFADQE